MREDRIALFRLHSDIDARVHTIRAQQPDWLCAKGCAGCCRRLAEIPRLTAMEWDVLREGLSALPAERLDEIRRAVAALDERQSGPVVCPLLDASTEACPVYAQRPVACRTYGFYMQRGLGLYCGEIESRVAAGRLDDVIWGNHDAIDQRLGGLGEARALPEWFARWARGD